MDTAIGMVVIGALVAILLWQKMSPTEKSAPQVVIDRPDPVIIREPVYEYPITYTSAPWRVPAYSYGSMYDYRRVHRPYVPRAWRPRPFAISPMRSSPPPMARPSVVPRIAMSHPIRPSPHGRGH